MTAPAVRSFVFAMSAIALWSTLAVVSLRLTGVPPFLLVGVALTIGSLCGVLRWRDWRVRLATLALGVYGLFGFHFFLFLALRNAPPVEANLINYLWPLLIVLLSPFFLPGYRLTIRHVMAASLGFAGAFLIVTGGHLNFSSTGILGYLWAGVSAVIWATYSLLSKRFAHYPTGAVGLFCLVSGVASLICHFLAEPSYAFATSAIVFVIALGIGPMGSAFFLWDAALKIGDPRTIGSLAYLTPLLSTVLLVQTGHGRMTPVTFIAMALIVSGAALGATFRGRPPRGLYPPKSTPDS